jgi:4-alpha-glucanotransferase
VLLHPTSLPGAWGIGDLGPAAFRFADMLGESGLKIWQVLPLGPTGYGDSPYQLFSAFAGNPLLIHLEGHPPGAYDLRRVEFERVIGDKQAALRQAYARFTGGPDFDAFLHHQASWLDDYALFMAAKRHFGEQHVWTAWPAAIAQRDPAALRSLAADLKEEIAFHQFTQFLFFEQWNALRTYCHERGIRLMGDVPIYVAHDSADVWSAPEQFELNANGHPQTVAGVPPDYFSATGQLWGNPTYRWGHHRDTGFAWWIRRLRAAFAQVDTVRLDHFRGFEAYWAVRAGEPTAVNGEWKDAPGEEMFGAVRRELGPLPIVAENLGVITPGVEALRERFGFPGMSILQFAFGDDAQAGDFKPHAYPRNRVAYSGTHDNDTTVGWWTSQPGDDSTRSASAIERERAHCRAYLDTDGAEIQWDFIRALMASVADVVLFPLQDILGLGSEARMNTPSKPSGNWRWRFADGDFREEHVQRLREMVHLYER